MLLAQLPRNLGHLTLRLRHRHARLDTSEYRERRQVPRRRLLQIEPQRPPDLRVGDLKRLRRQQ